MHFLTNAELTDRLLRVAYLLDLTDVELANVLGVDPVFVLDLHASCQREDLLTSAPGQRAAQLALLYDALSMQMPRWSDIRMWLDAPSRALGQSPRALIQVPGGLSRVIAHVHQ